MTTMSSLSTKIRLLCSQTEESAGIGCVLEDSTSDPPPWEECHGGVGCQRKTTVDSTSSEEGWTFSLHTRRGILCENS